jgi:hypothetical protein
MGSRALLAHDTGTIHDLPVYLTQADDCIDAYDDPGPFAEWLAGAQQIAGRWHTGDGASRRGVCDDWRAARGDVIAMAQAVLYARHLHQGVEPAVTFRPPSAPRVRRPAHLEAS